MDSNIDKIKIQRAMVVFKRMSPGNQLPLLREMHAATPLNTQNGMLNEAIAVGSNVFKMGVASYILSVEPVANYVKCAEKFIEAAESLSDILFKIHDAAECHGQKEKAVATSTEMIKSASTLSVLISPAKKRKSDEFSFSESIKPNKDEDDDDDDDYELNDNGKKHASLNHGALTLHTDYKMGKVVKTKKEDGFDKYMERNVHKKICPVVRNDERSYNLERKMRFMQAFIVQKGPL
jgi:hypothetical protein